jgi:hypothetical protein
VAPPPEPPLPEVVVELVVELELEPPAPVGPVVDPGPVAGPLPATLYSSAPMIDAQPKPKSPAVVRPTTAYAKTWFR